MMTEQYTSCRLLKTTVASLRRGMAGLQLDIDRNPSRYPEWIKGRKISVDDWINWQLAKQRRHTARAGSHKLAKRARGG